MIQRAIFETKDDWKEFRKGLFTASQISRLMTEPKKKDEVLSEGAKTYIEERVCELFAPAEPDYYNSQMERGNDLESQAVIAIARRYNVDVNDDNFIYTSVGGYVFFFDTEINLGGTPDVLMGNVIFEIKCPLSKTHLKYMTLKTVEQFKKVCPEYYAQMQCNMFLTDKNVGIFASYDDRFYNPKHHLHLLEVPRDDEFIERMLEKVQHANNYRNFLINQLNQ